jgi:hypothetical protein
VPGGEALSTPVAPWPGRPTTKEQLTMQRLKVVMLAMMAVLVLGAVVSATASAAEPEALGAPQKYTGTSGPGTLESLKGLKIECKSDTSEGEIKAKEVTTHIDFKECKGTLGANCTGLGEASGVILTLATGKLVYDSLTTLGVALLLTVTPVHLSCSIILLEVSGKVLCLIAKINVASKTNEIKCEATASDPKEVTYWEGGTEHKLTAETGLLTSENHAAAVDSSESTTGTIETTNNITIDG